MRWSVLAGAKADIDYNPCEKAHTGPERGLGIWAAQGASKQASGPSQWRALTSIITITSVRWTLRSTF